MSRFPWALSFDLPQPKETAVLEGFDVSFRNVHFSYDKEKVLNGVSFDAKKGTVTAIVGPSGSGKSTIARLLARFWDVDEGVVSLGGVNIKDMPIAQLMDCISYVSQENFLLDMTIGENIRIGKPEASDQEIEEAAAKAGCTEFIGRFPKGYDTCAGDAGDRLSGGEKQRISIARAILKDAPIVLLDEATASVDPENENHIQRAINELVKDKTLVVIAHRLSTVRTADQILVIDAGHLAEQRTHEELLRQEGIYSHFWKIRQSARNWKIKE